MSQHDGVIDNAAGAAFRSDLNSALMALLTLSSGASAPSTTFAYMWWADTANTLLKQRNAANSAWITIGTLDATNLGLLALTGGTLTGTLTMSGKPIQLAKGASVASSSGDIWTPADGNLVHLTGTSAISSFGTAPQAGAFRICIADAACSLTHGANLVCPGAANITLAAGDLFIVVADTTTKHLVLGPLFASGAPTSFLRDDAVTLAKMAHGTRGDLIKFGASGVPAYLALGTSGQYLKSDGTDTVWADLPSSGGITLGTPVTGSGSDIDFTSIPAGTKRVTIAFSGLSFNDNGELLIQIGDSGGIEISGYTSAATDLDNGTGTTATDGFIGTVSLSSSDTVSGIAEIVLLNASTNTWAMRGQVYRAGQEITMSSGVKALSAALDRVRITSHAGGEPDAGTVNIQYQ